MKYVIMSKLLPMLMTISMGYKGLVAAATGKFHILVIPGAPVDKGHSVFTATISKFNIKK